MRRKLNRAGQMFWLVIPVFAAVALAVTMIVRWLQGPCESYSPRGVRGEVTRQPDGTYLYFNGECWTTKPVTPTDSPF